MELRSSAVDRPSRTQRISRLESLKAHPSITRSVQLEAAHFRRLERQQDNRGRAHIKRALQAPRAAVSFGDQLGNRQTKPRAAGVFARRAGSIGAVKETLVRCSAAMPGPPSVTLICAQPSAQRSAKVTGAVSGPYFIAFFNKISASCLRRSRLPNTTPGSSAAQLSALGRIARAAVSAHLELRAVVHRRLPNATIATEILRKCHAKCKLQPYSQT